MDIQKFIEGIQLTGFPLENQAVGILKAAGWSIISNKYYIDSDKSVPREIDIVAYRVGGAEVQVVTVLIISCKKSEKNAWTFLTRKAPKEDPNFVSDPVHFWTDHKPLKFVLAKNDWRDAYHTRTRELGVHRVLEDPDYQVFAFQEMAKGTPGSDREGKAAGDSTIFESIMSLMKAQFHEMSLRETTPRPKPRIYQFNLISLADTEFIQFVFENENITAREVDFINYVGSYIFNRCDTFARVLFVRVSEFGRLLDDYGKLHIANKKIAREQIDLFYKDILLDYKRKNVLKGDFQEKLGSAVWIHVFSKFDDKVEFDRAFVVWSNENHAARVFIPAPDEAIEYMNNNIEICEEISKVLLSVYKYSGSFECINGVPF